MKRRTRGNTPRPPIDLTRRRLLAGAAGAAGSLILPACSGDPGAASAGTSVPPPPPYLPPDPSKSGIDHIVVLMMENRSFDHFLGWMPSERPGVDGMQAGLKYARSSAPTTFFDTYPLATDFSTGQFQGCAFQDPDHSHEGAVTQYNNGACDGFLETSPDDTFPIGYYTKASLPFLGQAALDWTVYDKYFCSILAETYPNRFYMHAAQTPQMHNNITQAFVQPNPYSTPGQPGYTPTIWDLLKAKGVSGNYYYNDAPFIGLWGDKYMSDGTAQPYSAFLTACQTGTLPSVAYVDPSFEDEGSGTSRDDHPHADIRDGQVFMNQVYNAIVTSPHWTTDKNVALFITYDEWGGFFDHVAPPVLDTATQMPPSDQFACTNEGITPFAQLGFRVPTLAISPYARRNYVSHAQYDHTSILKMIEWRFGLANLTVRDQIANNIAESLDFVSPPNAAAPTYTVPAPSGATFGSACSVPASPGASATRAQLSYQKHVNEVRQLKALAKFYGYPVK